MSAVLKNQHPQRGRRVRRPNHARRSGLWHRLGLWRRFTGGIGKNFQRLRLPGFRLPSLHLPGFRLPGRSLPRLSNFTWRPRWDWQSHLPQPSGVHDWTLYGLISLLSPQTRRSLMIGLGLTVLTFSAWIFLFSPKGLLARNNLREVIAGKQSEIAELRRTNVSLAGQLSMLGTDTDTIEGIARDELNMAMPGESIYRTMTDGPPRFVMNSGSR